MPQYRELRPAGQLPEITSSSSSQSTATEKTTKRQIVVVACEGCRKRKGRCDGQRPTCGPCQKRNLSCAYDAGPDATRQSALKQRYDLASRKLREMETLYEMLRTRNDGEAQTILQLIRSNPNASVVLKRIKDGNLLLPQPTQPNSPQSSSAPQGFPIDPLLFRGHETDGETYSGLGKATAQPSDSQMLLDGNESDAYGEDDDEEM